MADSIRITSPQKFVDISKLYIKLINRPSTFCEFLINLLFFVSVLHGKKLQLPA